MYTDTDNAYDLANGIGYMPATKWLDLRYHTWGIIEQRIEPRWNGINGIKDKDKALEGKAKVEDSQPQGSRRAKL
ncbi:hypothetical protein N7488_005320 [Penicillium malachiteum]|nr:hypothetical protein N7488_005320 [Penicillium malachiteum]